MVTCVLIFIFWNIKLQDKKKRFCTEHPQAIPDFNLLFIFSSTQFCFVGPWRQYIAFGIIYVKVFCPSSTLKDNENSKNPKASRPESVPDLKPRKYASHPLTWVSPKIINASRDVTFRQTVKSEQQIDAVHQLLVMSQTPFVRRKFTINIRGAGGTTRFTFRCVERAITRTIRSRNPPLTSNSAHVSTETAAAYGSYKWLQACARPTHWQINESCIPVDRAKLTEFHDPHHHLVTAATERWETVKDQCTQSCHGEYEEFMLLYAH